MAWLFTVNLCEFKFTKLCEFKHFSFQKYYSKRTHFVLHLIDRNNYIHYYYYTKNAHWANECSKVAYISIEDPQTYTYHLMFLPLYYYKKIKASSIPKSKFHLWGEQSTKTKCPTTRFSLFSLSISALKICPHTFAFIIGRTHIICMYVCLYTAMVFLVSFRFKNDLNAKRQTQSRYAQFIVLLTLEKTPNAIIYINTHTHIIEDNERFYFVHLFVPLLQQCFGFVTAYTLYVLYIVQVCVFHW